MAGQFIKLTSNSQRYQGECWVRIDAIRMIEPADHHTGIIWFDKYDFLYVVETPTQILAKMRAATS